MSHTHLTAEERDSIAHMHALGHYRIEIARKLSRDPSTISRELRRNSDAAGKYFAGKADRKVRRRRQRLQAAASIDKETPQTLRHRDLQPM